MEVSQDERRRNKERMRVAREGKRRKTRERNASHKMFQLLGKFNVQHMAGKMEAIKLTSIDPNNFEQPDDVLLLVDGNKRTLNWLKRFYDFFDQEGNPWNFDSMPMRRGYAVIMERR